jgi:hypothetical protein
MRAIARSANAGRSQKIRLILGALGLQTPGDTEAVLVTNGRVPDWIETWRIH